MSVPVCVIVGAGPGNGAAFARQFSRAGYRVALLARSRDVLETLVAQVAGAHAYIYDAADPDDIAESVFFLARQPRSAWTFELDLRPFREPW
jgi:NADP-dependent 3-hydroxy acid dehydrogenase YdfG